MRDHWRQCAWHKPVQLGFIQFMLWAEALEKAGMKPGICADCNCWFYPCEMGVKPTRPAKKVGK